MVERLREAIEKARRHRETAAGGEPAAGPGPAPALATAQAPAPAPALSSGAPQPSEPPGEGWARLRRVELSAAVMRRQRLVSYDRGDPAHVVFDVLRTRVLRLCRAGGWTRVGLLSQTPGCGKTFVAINLAMSVARMPNHSAVVVDLDLKAPHMAKYLGLEREAGRLRELLLEDAPLEAHVVRAGDALAFALNARRERDSGEVIQNAATAAALDRIQAALRPTLMLVDLPPLRVGDDALGALERLDAAILVAAAGETTADQIREAERLLVEHVNFLGVVLNKHDADIRQDYHYDYDATD